MKVMLYVIIMWQNFYQPAPMEFPTMAECQKARAQIINAGKQDRLGSFDRSLHVFCVELPRE